MSRQLALMDIEIVSFTKFYVNRIRTSQRAMERAILDMSLRENVRNIEIRRRTKVIDIMEHVARMKLYW